MKLLLLLAVLCPALLSAQTIRQQTDSLRAETCRGGRLSASGLTCTGATATTRVTVIRRLANRVDSIAAQQGLGAALSVHYASGFYGSAVSGVDTVTVCGKLHYPNHTERIAWPPIRLRTIGDSAGPLFYRFGNPLWQMCFNGTVTAKDSVPVVWSLEWLMIDSKRVLRPTFRLP